MRELIQTLCSPITQVIILICMAGFYARFTHKKGLAKSLLFMAIIWLSLCSQYFFSSLLLQPIEYRYPAQALQARTLSTATQIYILAGYYQTSTTLPEHTRWSDATYQRISNGLFLSQYWDIPLIISGGNFLRDTEQNYTEAVANFYLRRGVAENNLILVKTGTNTYEELTAVAPLLAGETTIIISSATHITRIAMILNKIAPNAQVRFFPVDYLSSSTWTFSLNNPSAISIAHVERAIYEYIALLYLYLQQKFTLK